MVFPKPLLMAARYFELPESGSLGAQLVGHDHLRSEALFSEQLAHESNGRALITPGLNQHIQDLALVINRMP
jgi:hypothetical protein